VKESREGHKQSNPKQPSCKKCAAPKMATVKKKKIKGGGQEMAVMAGKISITTTQCCFSTFH